MVESGIRCGNDRHSRHLPFRPPYPTSAYSLACGILDVLIAGGVLLLFFTWRSMRNARALKAQGGRVTVDGNRVTYPEVEKGKVEYRSFLTTDIEYIKDDEEEHQCKVKTPDNYIIFEAKYFDSWEEFEAFRALLG